MYDSNQLFSQLGVPKKPEGAAATAKQHEYVARYGQLMRNSTRQIVTNTAKLGDGIFLPSCILGLGLILNFSRVTGLHSAPHTTFPCPSLSPC